MDPLGEMRRTNKNITKPKLWDRYDALQAENENLRDANQAERNPRQELERQLAESNRQRTNFKHKL